MNRSDFQELAELHLQHAKALLDAQLYSGAYYMCGYGIEFAWERLIKAAGIESEFSAARAADEDLNVNWDDVVKSWWPDSRYEQRTQREARALLTAVADPNKRMRC